MKSKFLFMPLLSTLLVFMIFAIAPAQSSSGGYVNTWGGTSLDQCTGVVTDNNGNVYVTGEFMHKIDLDPGPREEFRTTHGDRDIFLTKFDNQGALQWTRTWGSKSEEYGKPMAIDKDGFIYVTGIFTNTCNFDPGTGRISKTAAGGCDVFLCKYSPDGTLVWTFTFGGTDWDWGQDVATDSQGDVYITGNFKGAPKFGGGQISEERISYGLSDAYLSKITSDGKFLWVRNWGSGNHENGRNVEVDSHDNIYVVGAISSPHVDCDPGAGVNTISTNGGQDPYISKFDKNGKYLWTKSWGGYSNDAAIDLALDQSDNLYITGFFQEDVDFNPGEGVNKLVSNGSYDAYLLKLNSNGGYLWAKSWGSEARDDPQSVYCHGSGSVYVAGVYRETCDFDTGNGVTEVTSEGRADIFLTKFGSDGSFKWVRNWGGIEDDAPKAVVTDKNGTIYLAGYFSSQNLDFDPGDGEYKLSSVGAQDAILIKLNSNGNW